MALFEQSPGRNSSRFGKLSTNMFFTRNTAKPKRVKHIEGLNGALICNVNDDPIHTRSRSSSALDFSKTNLPNLEPTRRAERLLPPLGFWNTHGVVQDTDRWRQELALLASASGLGVEREDHPKYYRPLTNDQQHASRSGARYSARTGRFNESVSKSRGRTGSKYTTPHSDMLFNVPENEREMWMLQVLCQLLGTSSLEDVQSWLVSATYAEKEQARTMIHAALRGLKESERTISNQSPQPPIDFDSLTNFVAKQKNEEKQLSQKYIRETLARHPSASQSNDEEHQQEQIRQLSHSWTNLANHPTTYQNSFQTRQPPVRSISSFETTHNKHDELIETNQFNDNEQQRPQSASPIKSPQPQMSMKRSVLSQQQKQRIDVLQLNDDDNDRQMPIETNQQQEQILPPIKSSDTKTRQIRELQNRLSRQEEEAKKQLSELQSKQSRLENALKLLTKQATPYGKRHSQNSSDTQPRRSYSGIWKPDASTVHRLQGN